MLTLRNLAKSYGGVKAVDNVSLEIKPGEILGLLGPNGAGKSTTVNLCVGLLTADEGTIELAGSGAPSTQAARRQIGLAPQELALYEEFTGRENVAFFGRLFGLRGPALETRVRAALEFVGLWDRSNDLARVYSGGMKRRLNLAIAIVHQPKLLLLDEPTVGVDPQSRNAILDNVLELRRTGVTVVYTTHYMEEAQKLCDRVAIVDHGRLLALDSVPALIAAHGGKTVVEIDDGQTVERIETDNPLAELAQRQTRGVLTNFRVEQPDLESVFLHLTGRKLRD